MEPTKQCNACGVHLPLECFSPDKRNKDGLQGRCKPCMSDANRITREKHRDKILARKRDYRERNIDKLKASAAEYRARTKDAAAKRNSAWAKRNAAKNREKVRRYEARRRRAIPRWADLEEIRAVYAKAEQMRIETGVAYEVDHIVPLNSPIVQGLHVASNLQIITAAENASKKNRHWPDMP